jgi:hypothetical protein
VINKRTLREQLWVALDRGRDSGWIVSYGPQEDAVTLPLYGYVDGFHVVTSDNTTDENGYIIETMRTITAVDFEHELIELGYSGFSPPALPNRALQLALFGEVIYND